MRTSVLDEADRLLIVLSRVRPEPEVEPEQLVGVEPRSFLYRAGRLGNFCLIARRYLQLAADLDPQLRAQAEDNLVYYRTREHFSIADVCELASELSRRGEPILLLKGAAYNRWIYPERGWRNFNDIDVLLRPSAVEPAIALLQKLGYRISDRIDGSVDLVRRLGGNGLPLAIELHTELIHHNEYPYYRADLAHDERAILDSGDVRQLGGVEVRIMRPVDELFYSVLHAFYHHDFAGLRYQSDLNALLTDSSRRLDIEEAIECARRARATYAVGLSLLVQERAFGPGAVPSALVEAMAPTGLRRLALGRVLPPLEKIPVTEGRVASHPAKVLVAPGVLGPLLLGLRWMFPGKRYLMYFYAVGDDAWSSWLYLRYPAAILMKALRLRTAR